MYAYVYVNVYVCVRLEVQPPFFALCQDDGAGRIRVSLGWMFSALFFFLVSFDACKYAVAAIFGAISSLVSRMPPPPILCDSAQAQQEIEMN